MGGTNFVCYMKNVKMTLDIGTRHRSKSTQNRLMIFIIILNNKNNLIYSKTGGNHMGKGYSGHTHTKQQLDAYANQNNPNNHAHQNNLDNHANQLNPNNEEFKK